MVRAQAISKFTRVEDKFSKTIRHPQGDYLGGSGALDLPQRVGRRDDGNAVIGFEIAQVRIPRNY